MIERTEDRLDGVALARERVLEAGWASHELRLVRWKGVSGRWTKLHVPVRLPREVGPRFEGNVTVECGLSFDAIPARAEVVLIPGEFGIPRDVLDRLCGACVLLAGRPA